MMEGVEFICPWTEKRIRTGVDYNMDYLIPVSLYPINELWNLVPADPYFNSHIKSDRLPSLEKLQKARPYIELAYTHYELSIQLSIALREDVAIRFATVQQNYANFPHSVTGAVVNLIELVAESRNLARF